LRTRWGRPLMITSAYRCGRHNQAVGGANLSEHREGAAFDVSLGNYLRSDLVHTARQVGFTGVGLYDTFVHLDVRKHAAEWTK
jgi:zinc D-Ala-D-Ala carboxypeptidase